jgi:hypothetical protein
MISSSVGIWSWQAFAGTQGLQFGQREIFGEPARHFFAIDSLGGFARGKFCVLRHVGGAADLVFMTRHRHAVARHHQIRLDEIRAIGNRLAVRSQRMFRPQRARATMTDHQHLLCDRCFMSLDSGSHYQCPHDENNPN